MPLPIHIHIDLAKLSLAELIWLNNNLSGGYWLGQIRRELNWQTMFHADEIRRSVDPFSWSVISGRR